MQNDKKNHRWAGRRSRNRRQTGGASHHHNYGMGGFVVIDGLYHYTLCGLDNIFLSSGYTLEETEYGPAVSIEDVDGLHRVIASEIVTGASPISPKELRFIRKQLDLPQAGLALLFGVDTQTVARWEKAENPIPVSVDRLLRAYYLGKINGNVMVVALLDRLIEMDEIDHGRRIFKETRTGWKAAA